jgi:hypothetical protein
MTALVQGTVQAGEGRIAARVDFFGIGVGSINA